ncbi:carboxypeptidase-like regulatory domain-containing protein [Croceimicrobium hydrocarbonivorans]|uniref:Carboxypeptidase regulatory-like domain-containing protein n=1 Tax=Croceimicrobium hydrocarbonivorans TaxID=2761580 RepID=A0A7H0VA85_9FLAO|nr:carboxypeptidase-like regulatory domain-containing protein [Croceimicrobium hydrocarbonivorans]QNR22633.1 carboxypeptidase regulatory-like domain-containing protein [Croceimicrobium hydrocarbonivorans]
MKSNTPLIFVLFLLMSFGLWAQQRPGSLKGTITDSLTGETIPLASISIIDADSTIVAEGQTDFDGKYHINPVPPGTYTVRVSFIAYTTLKMTGVLISPNSPTLQDFMMIESEENSPDELVVEYEVPLIDKHSCRMLTSEEIQEIAVRDIYAVAAPLICCVPSNVNSSCNPDAHCEYIIDGVKVNGPDTLPQTYCPGVKVEPSSGSPAQFKSKEEAKRVPEAARGSHIPANLIDTTSLMDRAKASGALMLEIDEDPAGRNSNLPCLARKEFKMMLDLQSWERSGKAFINLIGSPWIWIVNQGLYFPKWRCMPSIGVNPERYYFSGTPARYKSKEESKIQGRAI